MKTPTLNEWIDGLEEGGYRQTTACLMEKDEKGPCFCCMGVVSDLAGCEWAEEDGMFTAVFKRGVEEVEYNQYPTQLLSRMGFPRPFDVAHVLADANDKGHDFKTIAQGLRRVKEKGLSMARTVLAEFFEEVKDE